MWLCPRPGPQNEVRALCPSFECAFTDEANAQCQCWLMGCRAGTAPTCVQQTVGTCAERLRAHGLRPLHCTCLWMVSQQCPLQVRCLQPPRSLRGSENSAGFGERPPVSLRQTRVSLCWHGALLHRIRLLESLTLPALQAQIAVVHHEWMALTRHDQLVVCLLPLLFGLTYCVGQ